VLNAQELYTTRRFLVAYNCVVLIKQVPDTKRVTEKAMNEDGTVNRAALPAIFNPEDLNALEMALQIKNKYGGRVTAIAMGLPAASAILRESLYRGADDAVLVTDRRAAASDTLATSYILSQAIRKLGKYDIAICGRQAIDGDTAQVGPQLAEKLGVPQMTCVLELLELAGQHITVRRSIGNGWQEVRSKLPVLLTVTDEANSPRVAAAKCMMKYKKARSRSEVEAQVKKADPAADEKAVTRLADAQCKELEAKGLLIKQWDLDMLGADLQWCGRSGSPTKVHRIQAVVLTAKETKTITTTQEGIRDMVHELIVDHTIG
jgi:electron transfer flavoprotein beta subunit